MMNDGKNIRVELGERSYDILFDAVDGGEAMAAISALPQHDVLLVADSHTAQYLPRIAAALEKCGKTVYPWVFPAGEKSKNIDRVMALCGHAGSLKLGRGTLFAALGGGVTGDMTGFAAAIYMRGVDFIQIPTSLLAMVDSSVGGKTAVDTEYGKNLVGAFHQPRLVVIDCGLLRTLPAREIGNGMAEIIKTAMILDADFAGSLAGSGNIVTDPEKLRHAVRRSCAIKADVVSRDERESGDSGRVFLNYGHTFGHALEHLSGFRLAHGEAVALGMDIAAFAAEKLGLCGREVRDLQYGLLEKYHLAPADLPREAVVTDALRIVDAMKGDKKNGSGRFRAVLPVRVGEVRTVPLDPGWTAKMLEEYFAFRFSAPARPADRRQVAVLGLGLLGSSLALSLDRDRYRLGVWNRSPEACRWAADKASAEVIYASPEEAFADADLVILALPIPVTVDFIRRYHHRLKPGATVTDISSVKGGVMAAAEEFPDFDFVGSHPMAGTEKSGFAAGFAGLYDNADVFVVPGRFSTPAGIAAVEELWESLHGHVRRIGAAEHDALVAHTSHMLHIIASSLTRSILSRDDAAEQRRHYYGCATGFRDTSRIASSSPEMWREVCLENASAILPALAEFQHSLEEMREAVVRGDGRRFEELFRHGRDLRDSWLCYKNAAHLPQNIVLCGIKHSGKTTVGKEIAAILDIPFADSDDEIVRLDGGKRSVREIFRTDGEESFRRLEARALTALADSPERRVIALGGGALSNPFVPKILRERLGFKVCLDADDATAFHRIEEHGLPPFLADEADPFAAFVKMNGPRRELFAAEADTVIRPLSTPHRTALRILSLYKDRFLNH